MTLDIFLSNVCDMLHRKTSAIVTLELPTNDSAGLFLWPWKITENPQLLKMALHNRVVDPALPPEPPPFDVDFLILARPALTPAGLSLLENARHAIFESPYITVNEERARLTFQSISVEDLTAIFRAARIPMTLCLCVQGSGISGS